MAEFDEDARRVAAALIDGSYPAWKGSLRQIIDTKNVDTEARLQVQQLQEGGSPTSSDFLALFAASRLAYEENRAAFKQSERTAGTWKADTWPALIEARMGISMTPSVRATPEPEYTAEQEADRSVHQEGLGESLLRDLVPGIK